MSVKVNKKSLKQQGGAMIPGQPSMQPQQPMHQMPDDTMMPGATHGQSQQQQVDPEVSRITEIISTQVGQGADLIEVIQGLQQQQVDQNLIAQALMVAGMAQEDVISIFQTIERNSTPSTPTEVTGDPQLLARNAQIGEEAEGVDPMSSMMPAMQTGGENYNSRYSSKTKDDDDDDDEKTIANKNIEKRSQWYKNQNLSVAPMQPPAHTNVFWDALQTGATIKEELFSNETDDIGFKKGAFLESKKKNKFHKMTKPLYYDTSYTPGISGDNTTNAMNWHMANADEMAVNDSNNERISNQKRINVSDAPIEDEAPISKSTADKFSDWLAEKDTSIEDMSIDHLQTLRNLFSKTTGNSFRYGGSLRKAQVGDEVGGPLTFKDWYLEDPVGRGTAEGKQQYQDYVTNFDIYNFEDDNEMANTDVSQQTTQGQGGNDINKTVEGVLKRIGDNPTFKKYTSGSKVITDIAGFANRRYDEKDERDKLDQFEFMSQADNKYATKMNDPFSLGFYQENSGQLQGEAQKTTGYQMNFPGSPYSFGQQGNAKTGGETGGEIEVDQNTLAQLLAAGADIEIL
jgi:hypothetical protein